jgi:hypothetical protein
MDEFKTETGDRADLASIETNPVIGYIGNRCMPVVNVREKSGRVYYRTLTNDSAAQTDRTVGTAPATTLLTDSNMAFAVSEIIKRYSIDRSEVKQMGGIAQADNLGAAASKRSVQRAHEGLVAAQVLNGAGITVYDIEASLVARVQIGLEAIRRYPGRKAFVTSSMVFNRIMRYTEIVQRFSLASAVLTGSDAMNIIKRNQAALAMALAGVLGVDEVLVGDDDQWFDANGVFQDRACLLALPDPAEFSHKMDPVFGKCWMYLPDGKQPFALESYYDDDVKLNNYDAEIWQQLLILNPGAAYILAGIDDSNAVVTSTTTTTP